MKHDIGYKLYYEEHRSPSKTQRYLKTRTIKRPNYVKQIKAKIIKALKKARERLSQ